MQNGRGTTEIWWNIWGKMNSNAKYGNPTLLAHAYVGKEPTFLIIIAAVLYKLGKTSSVDVQPDEDKLHLNINIRLLLYVEGYNIGSSVVFF